MCAGSNRAGVVPTKLGHRPRNRRTMAANRSTLHQCLQRVGAPCRPSTSIAAGMLPTQLDGLLLRLLMQSQIEASLGGGDSSTTFLVLPRNRSMIRCSESDHSAMVMSRESPGLGRLSYAFEMMTASGLMVLMRSTALFLRPSQQGMRPCGRWRLERRRTMPSSR